jgi:hypothetical protein
MLLEHGSPAHSARITADRELPAGRPWRSVERVLTSATCACFAGEDVGSRARVWALHKLESSLDISQVLWELGWRVAGVNHHGLRIARNKVCKKVVDGLAQRCRRKMGKTGARLAYTSALVAPARRLQLLWQCALLHAAVQRGCVQSHRACWDACVAVSGAPAGGTNFKSACWRTIESRRSGKPLAQVRSASTTSRSSPLRC